MKQLFLIFGHVFEGFDDTAAVFDFHGSSSSFVRFVLLETLDSLDESSNPSPGHRRPWKTEKLDDEDRSETRHHHEKSNAISLHREN